MQQQSPLLPAIISFCILVVAVFSFQSCGVRSWRSQVPHPVEESHSLGGDGLLRSLQHPQHAAIQLVAEVVVAEDVLAYLDPPLTLLCPRGAVSLAYPPYPGRVLVPEADLQPVRDLCVALHHIVQGEMAADVLLSSVQHGLIVYLEPHVPRQQVADPEVAGALDRVQAQAIQVQPTAAHRPQQRLVASSEPHPALLLLPVDAARFADGHEQEVAEHVQGPHGVALLHGGQRATLQAQFVQHLLAVYQLVGGELLVAVRHQLHVGGEAHAAKLPLHDPQQGPVGGLHQAHGAVLAVVCAAVASLSVQGQLVSRGEPPAALSADKERRVPRHAAEGLQQVGLGSVLRAVQDDALRFLHGRFQSQVGKYPEPLEGVHRAEEVLHVGQQVVGQAEQAEVSAGGVPGGLYGLLQPQARHGQRQQLHDLGQPGRVQVGPQRTAVHFSVSCRLVVRLQPPPTVSAGLALGGIGRFGGLCGLLAEERRQHGQVCVQEQLGGLVHRHPHRRRRGMRGSVRSDRSDRRQWVGQSGQAGDRGRGAEGPGRREHRHRRGRRGRVRGCSGVGAGGGCEHSASVEGDQLVAHIGGEQLCERGHEE
mmetsp:Transcript_12898/g.19396  ORF Transcript_12898/g.19396 Transcript_12898/m.19396 type:complete len:592 (+) Transcript_12898:354-2129(+)